MSAERLGGTLLAFYHSAPGKVSVAAGTGEAAARPPAASASTARRPPAAGPAARVRYRLLTEGGAVHGHGVAPGRAVMQFSAATNDPPGHGRCSAARAPARQAAPRWSAVVRTGALLGPVPARRGLLRGSALLEWSDGHLRPPQRRNMGAGSRIPGLVPTHAWAPGWLLCRGTSVAPVCWCRRS